MTVIERTKSKVSSYLIHKIAARLNLPLVFRKRTRGACDNAVRKGGDSLTLKPWRQVSKKDSRDACIATATITQMRIQNKMAMISEEVSMIVGTEIW